MIEFKDFIITEDKLDTGLRGFPIGYVSTSEVKPDEGLFYMGQPVIELAKRSPEEVIYLLYHGEEGSKEEVGAFSQELYRRGRCHPKVKEHIYLLPKHSQPMDLFSCALLIVSSFERKNDWKEDCLNLIAKVPEIAAHVINFHGGFGGGESPSSQPELGYIENFTRMLLIPQKNSLLLKEALTLFNVLHFDHGGGNLSTFVGKAVASGLEDMYGSLAAAMNALNGPRHGKASEESLQFLLEIQKELGDNMGEENLDKLIRRRLGKGHLVSGFGHAVLRVEDTRAKILYDYALEKQSDHPLVKLALMLRQVGPKILKENPKISNPYPNVDAISGTVLAAAGFDYPQYFTLLFGLSRTVGISIQIMHERIYARGGKGVPIYRPRYIFKNPL